MASRLSGRAMHVFVSLDAEGCSGVTCFEQVTPGSRKYEDGRQAMLADLSAVLRGLRAAGARRIVVNDGHEDGDNLPFFGIEADAVVRGTGAPFSMMQGVSREFDLALFVGYHSRANAAGLMAHTYFPGTVEQVCFDGAPVGELEINGALAAYFGVPAAFVSGDDVIAATGAALGLTAVSVKQAIGNACAICPCDTRMLLERGAAACMDTRRLLRVPGEIEVTFADGEKKTYIAGDYGKTFIEMIDCMRKKDNGR